MNRRQMTVALAVAAVLASLALLAALYASRRRVEPYENLIVGMTDVGRGVFAQRNFAKGEVVETCPLLVKPTDQWGDATSDYVFEHGKKNQAMALGLCSLYNHSDKPNMEYENDDLANTMVTRAARDIKAGEELRISYGSDWFKNRDIKKVKAPA